MRRSRRIPRPLLILLLIALVEGLAWTYAVPALQGADESAHFGYVQKIADAGEIPWTRSREGLMEASYPLAVSTEQQIAWYWAGLEQLRGNRAARPLWTDLDERVWRLLDRNIVPEDRKDGAGTNAFANPPLYYLSAAVPYKIAGGTFFDRLFAMRLYGAVLLLATVALTWLLAGEVFGRRRELQTVAAAAVALQPVLLDTVTRVTPDALLVPLAAASLYLMAVVVRRGATWRSVLLLALAVTAAAFTHGRALGLVAPALLAIAFGWWNVRRRMEADAASGAGSDAAPRALEAAPVAFAAAGARGAVESVPGVGAGRPGPPAGEPDPESAAPGPGPRPDRSGPPSGSADGDSAADGRRPAVAGSARGRSLYGRPGHLAVPVALWAALMVVVLLGISLWAALWRVGEIPGFWSYLWQFYLPKLSWMETALGSPWGSRDVYVDRFFGTFVQFEVGFPRDLLDAVRVFLWSVIVGCVVAAWRRRRALVERGDVVLVLLATGILTVLTLHGVAFRSLLTNPADPVFTGRYLLMLIPLYGVAIAAATTALRGRLRAVVAGAVLAGLALLQLSALGIVVERFYA